MNLILQTFLIRCVFLFSLTLQMTAFGADSQHDSREAKNKIIYIHPGQWGDLFAEDNPIFNRDNCLEPVCRMREEAEKAGYTFKQTYSLDSLEDFEYLMVFEVPLNQLAHLEKYPKEKLILFLWEPPSVAPENYIPENHRYFSKIYTWHDDWVDNVKYFKLYYAVKHPMISNPVPFEDKKLATLICCNKASKHPDELYGERKNLITFFEKKDSNDFDLYGKWWPQSFKTYKGQVDKKVDVLRKYKFCFAYENIKGVPGYVTEKIFDCFHAGCVPVYRGAPNITSYVPQNCFINGEIFASYESLYNYLLSMKEPEYEAYIRNIQLYLNSEHADCFSSEHFVSTVMSLINTK